MSALPERPPPDRGVASFVYTKPAAATALLVLGAVALRLAYHLFLSRWELVGDEAYYWVESRRLAFGFAEKGPLLPALIAVSRGLFGDTEFAVRLPAILGFGVAAISLASLARSVTRDPRVAFLSAAIFMLVPAFQANAQISTQDALMIPLWVGLTALGSRLLRKARANGRALVEWLALGTLLGIGALLKQSVLLFVPCLAVQAFLERRCGAWGGASRRQLPGVALGASALLAVAGPMALVDLERGGPMLAHTLGHLGLGGDRPREAGFSPLWPLSLLAGVALAMGPPFVLLAVRGSRFRRAADPESRDRAWLLTTSLVPLAFFAALSLTKPVIASWPLPSLAPLVVLVAEAVVGGKGRVTRRTVVALVALGVASQLVLFFPEPLARLPVAGEKLRVSVLARFSGRREQAARVTVVTEEIARGERRAPMLVAPHYMDASLLTFYLPDHPVVFCAGTALGKRPTSYDLFSDTNLSRPELRGRTFVLVGGDETTWRGALGFESVEKRSPDVFVGRGFRGLLTSLPSSPWPARPSSGVRSRS